MNLNEFQKNNDNATYIVDPNLARKSQGTQENSGIATIVDPNIQNRKRKMTPQQMGFTHEEEKKVDPKDPILNNLDKAIARKQREAALLAQAIEESDGEAVSEDEFQDLLVQARDEINMEDPISEYVNDVIPSKTTLSSVLNENPTYNLMDELEAEMEEDENDYEVDHNNNFIEEEQIVDLDTSETTQLENDVKDNIFTDFVSGNINFDEETENLEDNVNTDSIKEKEEKEQLETLRRLVRDKISPVTKNLDISTFTISKKPAANIISTPRFTNGQKIADWVLMSSQRPIYMKTFTGTEMERLSNGGKSRSRLNRALDTWQLIYDHIVDKYKPNTLEEWAKVTSFLDIDHIYMAIYRANFEGSNYIPRYCTNTNCKEKVFLSDNFDIMDMCEFKDKEAKARFNSILGSETNCTSKLYSTELVPVSEDYAFAFREPSIYNIIFEPAVLDQEFVDKFDSLISICTYIDDIYYINRETRELQQVRVNVYPNNMKKTVKSRIINFSRIISTLNADQYNTLIAYMNKINEFGDSLTYKIPETTCPYCKTEIPVDKQDAQNLVFTRHQLAALATL